MSTDDLSVLRVVWRRRPGAPFVPGLIAPADIYEPTLHTATGSWRLTHEEALAYERAGVPSVLEGAT